MNWQAYFQSSLDEADHASSLRRRHWHVDESPVCIRRADGRRLVNFATNDYLGLRHDQRLIAAVQRSLPTTGVGSGASPLVSGYNLALAELEQRLARWQGTEACLVFSSGMSMNIGVIAALVGTDDLVLSDRLNHASLIDGCRLSGAHKRIYAHNDLGDVRKILSQERQRYQRALVVTESIFSMDGDAAPLAELQALCTEYDAGLLVDEAHATGIYGPTGAGMGEALQATSGWLGKLGTLSKAVGTCGGYLAGSQLLVDYLVNRCRSYIFSTAIAPPVVAATAASIGLMPELTTRRQQLLAMSRQLRERLQTELQTAGWRVPAGDSPIIPVIVGDNARTVQLSQRLLECGLFVPAIRPPTVPPGTARLRISLSALHRPEHIEQLAQELTRIP